MLGTTITEQLIINCFKDYINNRVDIFFTLKLPFGIKTELVEGIPIDYMDYTISEFKKTYNL